MAEDRRVRRTRHALLEAFNRLVLERRDREIRVGHIIAEAKVGRSTFYDHYAGADALHLEALRRPLAPLADAAAGCGNEVALTKILSHFWEYRQRARKSFDSRAEQLLADMVEERLPDGGLSLAKRLAARQLAGSAFAPVAAWLRAEAPSTAERLAAAIIASGVAARSALDAGNQGE